MFKEHADWFVKDADGLPLRSDRVTFGGWRRGPWYVLDGTHPGVQHHFEHVFKTMRQEWGCTYFKLDANFWGAMHGGVFHDARATRVEAYRRGMQAIGRGAGDAFLLGCNHPLWPSLGLIHGSRSSNDIKRTWDRVVTTARQNLNRNWQNGRLWWNDPDAVVLSDELTDAECRFHATAMYASGGMVLSGDDLTTLPPARAAMLRTLLPPTGIAAEFDDETLRVGHVRRQDGRLICLFNWDDVPRTVTVRLPAVTVTDHWTESRWDAARACSHSRWSRVPRGCCEPAKEETAESAKNAEKRDTCSAAPSVVTVVRRAAEWACRPSRSTCSRPRRRPSSGWRRQRGSRARGLPRPRRAAGWTWALRRRW